MKIQKHTEVYLDGMDTPAQYTPMHDMSNENSRSDVSRHHDSHEYVSNPHAGIPGAEMPTQGAPVPPPQYGYSAPSSGYTPLSEKAQRVTFEQQMFAEQRAAYQQGAVYGQTTNQYAEQTAHVDVRNANAPQAIPQMQQAQMQQAQMQTYYPVPASYHPHHVGDVEEEPRRWRRNIGWLLGLLLLVGIAGFVAMNYDGFVDADGNVTMPAIVSEVPAMVSEIPAMVSEVPAIANIIGSGQDVVEQDSVNQDDTNASSVLAGAQPQTAEQVSSVEDVTAEAFVKPFKHASLGMQASGIVREILVSEGDYVEEGQILLHLDNLQLQSNLIQAEAVLTKAITALADIKAGARAEEIAAAQAIVESHQARLQQLTEQPRNEDESAARAALAAAQSVVADLLDGPEEEYLIIARRELDNAKASLQVAQSAYNEVKWATDIARRPESVQLHLATNTYEAALANYEEVARGADDADIAQAYAAVERAKSQLAHVQVPARGSEISLVQAQMRNAQSQLDLLNAGARTQTVLVAEADVEIARAAVKQIEAALADTQLQAPFSGVIASLDVEVGETVAAGMVVLQLGDTTVWEIETDDLIDLDVVKITEGSQVSIIIDALPDVEMTGTVRRIKQFGETKFGDMTYTAYIQPDQFDERLRWNMTAEVVIESQN